MRIESSVSINICLQQNLLFRRNSGLKMEKDKFDVILYKGY